MSGANWVSFGSVGAGAQQFESPRGLFVDGTGRIYIADDLNNRVVRVDDMTGANWVEVHGSSPAGAGTFLGPAGVSVTGGKIYATSYKSSQVVEMDADMSGHNWKSLGSPGTGQKQFGNPLGIVTR
jgi:DNA-binding beta-propeller fold protein YncE